MPALPIAAAKTSTRERGREEKERKKKHLLTVESFVLLRRLKYCEIYSIYIQREYRKRATELEKYPTSTLILYTISKEKEKNLIAITLSACASPRREVDTIRGSKDTPVVQGLMA